MWSFITSIFTGSVVKGIGTAVKDYFDRRQRHKNAIEEAKVTAEIAMIEQKTRMIADADIASIEAQRYSIKDELVLILILGPYIGAFIPGLQPYIKDGFEIISGLPVWYQVAVIGIVISVMGLRFMLGRFFTKGVK